MQRLRHSRSGKSSDLKDSSLLHSYYADVIEDDWQLKSQNCQRAGCPGKVTTKMAVTGW